MSSKIPFKPFYQANGITIEKIRRTRKSDLLPVPSKSQINRMLADTWHDIAYIWWRKYRMKHFTYAAAAEYGYGARSRTYNRTKQKKLGHQLPLVLSGQSRELSKQFTIRASKNGASVSMPIRAFNYRSGRGARRGKSQVDMRKEFTTVSRAEQAEIREWATEELIRKFSKYSARIKVEI